MMTSRNNVADFIDRSAIQGVSDIRAHDDLEDFVRGAQSGDANSLAQLYDRFYDRIFRYVSFKIGNVSEAEDITEEVFLRLLKSISSFKFKGSPFSSWLFRIAHNLVVDYFRKNGRKQIQPLDDAVMIPDPFSPDLDHRLDVNLLMRQVNVAMEKLTDLQKEIITLRFVGQLSVRETAEAVGKNESAVKALQHAGIRNLRRGMNVAQACPKGLEGQVQ